jgi:hypothetical protein
MAEKKIKVVTVQGLKFEGKYQALGTELSIGEKEARRLIDLGAVTLPPAKIETEGVAPPVPAGKGKKGTEAPVDPAGADAVLLKQIAETTNLEELKALMPDTDVEPSNEVAAAFEARWIELEVSGQ